LRQKDIIIPTVAKPATKPRVLGNKTRSGRLAGTGVGDESLVVGAALFALASALAFRVRRAR